LRSLIVSADIKIVYATVWPHFGLAGVAAGYSVEKDHGTGRSVGSDLTGEADSSHGFHGKYILHTRSQFPAIAGICGLSRQTGIAAGRLSVRVARKSDITTRIFADAFSFLHTRSHYLRRR
jgi:hypothetical protein